MDFHRTSNFLVTASDDESIRLYDVANATYVFCLTSITFLKKEKASVKAVNEY